MSIHTVANGQSQTLNFSPVSAGTSEEIDASGTSQVDITDLTGRYPMTITVNEAPNTHLSTGLHLNGINFLNIKGDSTSDLTIAGSNDLGAAQATITPSVLGIGVLNVAHGGFLDLEGSVASGITVWVSGLANQDSELKIESTTTFTGSVNFIDGQVILPRFGNAASYELANGRLTIYGVDRHAFGSVRFNDLSPEHAGLAVSVDADNEVRIFERGTISTLPGKELPQYVAPQPPGHVAAVLIHDTTTNADVPDTLSQPYTGPVVGLQTQFIDITPDSLNITASAPNMFIHTGGGNDAINVSQSGGTNVLDGGTGSNFLTGGKGADTFFVDARNAPSDTWSTVVGFHSGDAATLFGVSQAADRLDFSDNGGAVGATGLTLHAYSTGKPIASITIAGFSKADLASGRVTTSFGNVGGSDYLYLHAT